MTPEKPRVGGPVGQLAEAPVNWLIFFAVKEEAKFFVPLYYPRSTQVWLTGMGRRNAVENFRYAVAKLRPRRVLTCGFAGGLNPIHPMGKVLFDADFDAGLAGALEKAGGEAGKFHCVSRVAVTAAEKRKLWEETNADAVEMESAVIRELCRQNQIPGATVRVISDAAGEDLILDFNALMTADQCLSYSRLIRALILSPSSIPKLISFQRQTILAARELARVLKISLRSAIGGRC
jgi:adenosylhomocysteine nucleosidase